MLRGTSFIRKDAIELAGPKLLQAQS